MVKLPPAAIANKEAAALYGALRSREEMEPISSRVFEIADAYAISRQVLDLRQRAGERVIGYKVGLTTPASRAALGAIEPDVGWLTNAMQLTARHVSLSRNFNKPRLEAELAFVVGEKIDRPVDQKGVAAVVSYVMPAFEIIDTRISDWRVTLIDTVADNASSAAFRLGDSGSRCGSVVHDAPASLSRNEELVGQSTCGGALQSGLAALAWVANFLGRNGEALEAGDIVLSGAIFPPATITAGDRYCLDFGGVGRCGVEFTP